jgi:hypothetical protein
LIAAYIAQTVDYRASAVFLFLAALFPTLIVIEAHVVNREARPLDIDPVQLGLVFLTGLFFVIGIISAIVRWTAPAVLPGGPVLATATGPPPIPFYPAPEEPVAPEEPQGSTFTRVEPEAKPGLTVDFGISASNVGTAFVFNGQVPFHIYQEGDRVFCDVKVYSVENRQPIEIKHNELQTLPPGWDSNSNDTGLEVVDEQHRPVFQMYYETPTELRIQGIIFVQPAMVVMVNGEDQETFDLSVSHTPEQEAFVLQRISEFHLDRLFKYPSAMFPGVPN